MRNTRSFFIGPLPIGGGAPVTVQSMTNTDTRDAAATLSQVRALAQAGCDIVRLSVYDEQCLEALPAIIEGSPVPLVADIHYRADLAVGAMERGIAKVRINPGNIGSVREVRRVADCAKMHHVPIRIGVNSGSVEKEILAQEGGVTARGMLRSALGHARLLEEAGFHDIVLSLKASSVPLTVEAYRLAAKETDYPLHVGVTEAGLPGAGNIKSAIGIGALLLTALGTPSVCPSPAVPSRKLPPPSTFCAQWACARAMSTWSAAPPAAVPASTWPPSPDGWKASLRTSACP